MEYIIFECWNQIVTYMSEKNHILHSSSCHEDASFSTLLADLKKERRRNKELKKQLMAERLAACELISLMEKRLLLHEENCGKFCSPFTFEKK